MISTCFVGSGLAEGRERKIKQRITSVMSTCVHIHIHDVKERSKWVCLLFSLPTFCNYSYYYNCPPSFSVLFSPLVSGTPLLPWMVTSPVQVLTSSVSVPWDTCLSISSFLGSWLLHDVTFTHTLALCHLVEVRTSLEKKIRSVLNLKIDFFLWNCNLYTLLYSELYYATREFDWDYAQSVALRKKLDGLLVSA